MNAPKIRSSFGRVFKLRFILDQRIEKHWGCKSRVYMWFNEGVCKI